LKGNPEYYKSNIMKTSNILLVKVAEIVETRGANFGQFLLKQRDSLGGEADIFGAIVVQSKKVEIVKHTDDELVDIRCQDVSCVKVE
jgi:hypothetical protein